MLPEHGPRLFFVFIALLFLGCTGTVPREDREHVAAGVDWDDAVSETDRILACDAQTSGGLLVALPEAHADDLVGALRAAGVSDAAQIGRATGAGEGRIRVR